MSEIWEKQDFETPHRYKLFCVYRDMGITRSLQKVSDKLGKPKKYRRCLEVFSRENKWVERVNSYDLYISEESRKANEEAIIEMKKRHIQQSLLMQKNVIARIQNSNPQEMTLSDCVKMLDVAVKIERLSRDCKDGEVQVNNKVVVDTKESIEQKKLENLTSEELEELEELMKKMQKK